MVLIGRATSAVTLIVGILSLGQMYGVTGIAIAFVLSLTFQTIIVAYGNLKKVEAWIDIMIFKREIILIFYKSLIWKLYMAKFDVDISVPSNSIKLFELATDFENFSRFSPAQIKKISIIVKAKF